MLGPDDAPHTSRTICIIYDEVVTRFHVIAPQSRGYFQVALESLIDVVSLPLESCRYHNRGILKLFLWSHPRVLPRIAVKTSLPLQAWLNNRRRTFSLRVQSKVLFGRSCAHHKGQLLHGHPIIGIIREAHPHG